MHRSLDRLGTLLGVLVAGLITIGPLGVARAQEAPRATYDFEQDTAAFTAITVKDGQPAADATSKVSVTRDKNQVKSGTGSLSYEFTVAPHEIHALTMETRIPSQTRSVRFWLRSSVSTAVLFSLRKERAGYELVTQLPAFEWVPVGANLDELTLGKNDTDPDGKLEAAQVRSLSIADVANLLVNGPPEAAKLVPAGPRQLWLDDLQFSSELLPQTTGLVKAGGQMAYLVDNFETGTLRWATAAANFAGGAPMFRLFPPEVTARISTDAAAPGAGKGPLDPGGKGMRLTYKRGPQDVVVLVRGLERVDLSKADHLKLSVNASVKSFLIVQLKEKDGAEYQSVVMPDDSTGWHHLDLPLSAFTLGGDSKDANGKLDPDQITELAVIDGSSALGGAVPGGDVTLDLDAIYFTLKP